MRILMTVAFILSLLTGVRAHDLVGLNEQFQGMSEEDVARARATFEALTPEGLRASARADRMDSGAAAVFLKQFEVLNPAASEQLYLKSALWPANHELRVCFLDGDDLAREHVLAEFTAILALTNLSVADDASGDCAGTTNDMQISFGTKGCYSYYGRQARIRIRDYPDLPTVGLCGEDGPIWSAKANGTIRHELMHGLGAIHEHQHPSGNCVDEFDIKYMEDNRLFDPDETENRKAILTNIEIVTKKYDIKEIAQLPYDAESVMHYDLPAQFFLRKAKSPCYLGEPNNELSEADAKMLTKLYPKE
ncbi:hypothetical protein AB9E29_14985 [Rhizobium leguminosarum]|uniref:hypothetical protein n=1 Tax=Rhizobium leguminosarum TaxID=384 RepID=UPI003F9E3A95